MMRAHEVQAPQAAGASRSDPRPDTAQFPVTEDEKVRADAPGTPRLCPPRMAIPFIQDC